MAEHIKVYFFNSPHHSNMHYWGCRGHIPHRHPGIRDDKGSTTSNITSHHSKGRQELRFAYQRSCILSQKDIITSVQRLLPRTCPGALSNGEDAGLWEGCTCIRLLVNVYAAAETMAFQRQKHQPCPLPDPFSHNRCNRPCGALSVRALQKIQTLMRHSLCSSGFYTLVMKTNLQGTFC